jgi:hypothetical protein
VRGFPEFFHINAELVPWIGSWMIPSTFFLFIKFMY